MEQSSWSQNNLKSQAITSGGLTPDGHNKKRTLLQKEHLNSEGWIVLGLSFWFFSLIAPFVLLSSEIDVTTTSGIENYASRLYRIAVLTFTLQLASLVAAYVGIRKLHDRVTKNITISNSNLNVLVEKLNKNSRES